MSNWDCDSCTSSMDTFLDIMKQNNAPLAMMEDDEEDDLMPATRPVIKEKAQAVKLMSWLNNSMKIEMGDGRTLIGIFLCTDRDNNVILGSCNEYLSKEELQGKEEPRFLGLAMIPGPHIKNIYINENSENSDE